MSYTGPEQRGAEPGRRSYDGVCMLHDPTIANCKEERKNVQDSLAAIWKKIDGMISWKVFAFLAPIAVTVAGAGFWYFAQSISRLDSTVQRMEVVTGTLVYRIDRLEKKMP